MSARGERYKSAKQMRMHEASEGTKEREMEYGITKPAPIKKRRVRRPSLKLSKPPIPGSGVGLNLPGMAKPKKKGIM